MKKKMQKKFKRVFNMRKKAKLFLTFFLVLATFSVLSTRLHAAYDIPPKPSDATQTFVYDYIKLFDQTQYHDMALKLKKYGDETSTQIVVATINSTEGEDIDYLGAQWLTKWGIGQAKKDNGVLIILAKGDRRVAISTGYGVEHLLTDLMSRRIIEQDMIPQFKKGDYYNGIDLALDSIAKVLKGEFVAEAKKQKGMPPGLIIFLVVFFFAMIVLLMNIGRGGGGFTGGGYGGGYGGYSSGGFGGGGFSGGGGFDIGGGGFGGGMGGGGGASGGW